MGYHNFKNGVFKKSKRHKSHAKGKKWKYGERKSKKEVNERCERFLNSLQQD